MRIEQIITDESGVSLIEILISIVIGAIALLALASMQTTAIQGNAFSGRDAGTFF